MKKLLIIFLAVITVFTLLSCSETEKATETQGAKEPDKLKIGVICAGDENESETKAHIIGVEEMLASLGLPADSVVFKYHVDENGTACKDTAIELANSGCDIIFGTSNFYE